MRLVPRVEKLEAAVPAKCYQVTRIELVGIGDDRVLAVADYTKENGWTPFAMQNERRAV